MKLIKVFHLEDCEEDAYIFDSVLYSDELYGFKLEQFKTLKTLEEALKESEPDALVIDLNISECQGFETLERVKSFSNNIPVIVITGTHQDYMGERAISAGAADFIPKIESRSQVVKRSIIHAILRSGNREL